eukprot:2815932-Heterocapsa_arctica.AAC.1
MALRSAQQRGPPSVDGRVRGMTDKESFNILREKCFTISSRREKCLKKHHLATIVNAIFYACEAAYQTMHGFLRFVRRRKDGTTLVPRPALSS